MTYRTYRCVDFLHQFKSEDIEASSPDIAIKSFFKINGMLEKPVRSKTQTHKREHDSRFYTYSNPDETGYKVRHSMVGYNREGYEYNICENFEFNETDYVNLEWCDCVPKR